MINHQTAPLTLNGLHWRALGVLSVAGSLAVVLLLPYQLALVPLPAKLPLPVPAVLLAGVLQSTVLLGVCAALGLWLGPPVGLGFPALERWLAGHRAPPDPQWQVRSAIVTGGATGLVIIAVLLALPLPQATVTNPAWWKGLLASFYGGIGEEVLLRLGVMTLLVRGLGWVWRSRNDRPAAGVYWLSLVAAAVLFGAGHLPLAATLYPLTPRLVFTIVAANAVGGLVFGWLYWRRGFGVAIVAHFTADLVLHVASPLLAGLLVHH